MKQFFLAAALSLISLPVAATTVTLDFLDRSSLSDVTDPSSIFGFSYVFSQDGFRLGDSRFSSNPAASSAADYTVAEVNMPGGTGSDPLHIEHCCGPYDSSYILGAVDGRRFNAASFRAGGSFEIFSDGYRTEELRAPNINVKGYRDGAVVANQFFETIDYVTQTFFALGSAFSNLDSLVFSNALGTTGIYDSELARLQGQGLEYVFNDAHSSVSELTLSFANDSDFTPIPLPAGGLLMLTALGGLLVMRRRQTI